jgi:threonine aldolase
MPQRGFASDNNAGVHPDVLSAIASANVGHVPAYGDDPWTASMTTLFQQHFGPRAHAFLVFNGTGANVLSLASLLRPHEAVICARDAHIHADECGAPERFVGCKLLEVECADGKLTVDGVQKRITGVGNPHHVQPRAVSISQSTERGTVYTPEEIQRLAGFVHAHGMMLHMDGARLANAAASLGVGLREITVDCGVDVLSWGGTKNGLMLGEAVVFLSAGYQDAFPYLRKQAMQLCSKMRFVAVQVHALLQEDLWLRNARHANAMARLLGREVGNIPAVRVTQPIQANAVFATLPRACIAPLLSEWFFYVWDQPTNEVRWMCSFDTTEEDVRSFALCIRKTCSDI